MKLGAKIEFEFLVQGENGPILRSIAEVLHAHGWNYNHFVPGEYTIWLDGPITKLGESRTVSEAELSFDPVDVRSIAQFLKEGYSPSVILGNIWFDKPLRAFLLVAEGDGSWRTTSFAIDHHESIGRFRNGRRDEAKAEVMELFRDISIGIDAYCGVCGIEIFSLPDNPLDLRKFALSGEIAYISPEMLQERKIVIVEEMYDYEQQTNGGTLAWRRDGFLEIEMGDLVGREPGISLHP